MEENRMEEKKQIQIPPEQVIQMQFNKIGQLTFQIDIMQQQMVSMEQENNQLKAESDALKNPEVEK
jgi:regulator of replication initiation timing